MIRKGTRRPVSIRLVRRLSIRTVVETPAEERDLANIEHMIPLPRIHVLVLPLGPEQVHSKRRNSNSQTDSAAPPDNWCTEEVILDLSIAPSTHPQSEVQEGPVKRLRSQDVFLVRIGDESVVRSHHRYVEMPPITKER